MPPKTKISKKQGPAKQAAAPPADPARFVPYALLALVLVLFAYVRVSLLSFPLERDEGEYAYLGQLMLNGIAPFKLAYNLKLPGTACMYALSMAVFGQTKEGIRLGLLFFNLGSLVFLFFIGRKLFNSFVAVSAAAVCAVLSVNPVFLGQAAHATQFVTFYMLGGVFFLIRALEKGGWHRYFISGLFLGLALVMKQSGFFFAVFGGLIIAADFFVLRKDPPWKSAFNLGLYGAGAALPLALVFLAMFSSGVFEKFWFWTFIYPAVYATKVPVSAIFEQLSLNIPPLFAGFIWCWVLAGLGVPALFLRQEKPWSRFFLGLFAVFSLLPAVPGFYFRGHYFIPFIPALGLLAGLFLSTLNRWAGGFFKQAPRFTAALLVLALAAGLKNQADFYFKPDPLKLCSQYYHGNYFAELTPVADYIRNNTAPQDTVMVFGSEPEIYFQSGRKSATGYIYMYDLVYVHPYAEKMRREMMAEVEKSKPKYFISVLTHLSWLAKPGQVEPLLAWRSDYLRRNRYTQVGVIELEPARYLWDREALNYVSGAKWQVLIHKRDEGSR